MRCLANKGLVVLTGLLLGCGAAVGYDSTRTMDQYGGARYGDMGRETSRPEKPTPKADMKPAADESPIAANGLLADRGESQGSQTGAQAIERKIIYSGDFTVDVHDIQKGRESIVQWAESRGGYMQVQQGNTVVVRIPAADFGLTVPKLRELGRIDDSLTDIRAQDVTEEFYDLELRLQTRRSYLASLEKMLHEAGKLEEKLAVQREIGSVVTEIEQMEGRMRVLSHLISFATVTVTFRPAYVGPTRTFRLPWEWLDTLGVDFLMN